MDILDYEPTEDVAIGRCVLIDLVVKKTHTNPLAVYSSRLIDADAIVVRFIKKLTP